MIRLFRLTFVRSRSTSCWEGGSRCGAAGKQVHSLSSWGAGSRTGAATGSSAGAVGAVGAAGAATNSGAFVELLTGSSTGQLARQQTLGLVELLLLLQQGQLVLRQILVSVGLNHYFFLKFSCSQCLSNFFCTSRTTIYGFEIIQPILFLTWWISP